jgi:DNA-binding MarR family transcriptional regulator
MSYAELLISNQLCFLVYRLHLAISAHHRLLLWRFGLTYGPYLAMQALWEHRELPHGELCRVLALDTGTVSPLLKRLETAGLARRDRKRDDERVVVVKLTNAGIALEEKARGVPLEIVRFLVADENDYVDINDTLKRLIERAEGKENAGFDTGSLLRNSGRRKLPSAAKHQGRAAGTRR